MAVTRGLRNNRDLQNRLRSVQGHMSAIERMIADDAPCTEILRQLLAVRGAMSAIQRELWRAYLLNEQCGLQSNEEKQRARAWRELQETLMRESRT